MKKYLSFNDFESFTDFDQFRTAVTAKLLVSLPALVYEHSCDCCSISVRGIVNDALANYNGFDCSGRFLDPFYISVVFKYIDNVVFGMPKTYDDKWLKWCNNVLSL